MPILRRSGGTNTLSSGQLITLSPIWIRPPSLRSRPAIIRSVVVFPHPLGPSNVRNLPSSASRLTSSTARTAPKLLLTPERRTADTLLVDLPRETSHLGHRLQVGRAEERRPGSLLLRGFHYRTIAILGVDRLGLVAQKKIHEQPRGIGMRGVLENRRLVKDVDRPFRRDDGLERQPLKLLHRRETRGEEDRVLPPRDAPLAPAGIAGEARVLGSELFVELTAELPIRCLEEEASTPDGVHVVREDLPFPSGEEEVLPAPGLLRRFHQLGVDENSEVDD